MTQQNHEAPSSLPPAPFPLPHHHPVVITGFMAAGKTTIARELARVLGHEFIDLDDVIIQQHSRSISDIIDNDGRASFRQVETDALRATLALNPRAVIALGGGTWTISRNRDLIKRRRCISVWLDAPFEACWARILESTVTRPFARDHDAAAALYEKRRGDYAAAAIHIRLEGSESAEDIVKSILDRIIGEQGV
jgi:shikimate kinase